MSTTKRNGIATLIDILATCTFVWTFAGKQFGSCLDSTACAIACVRSQLFAHTHTHRILYHMHYAAATDALSYLINI